MSKTSARQHNLVPNWKAVTLLSSMLWRVASLGLDLLVRETGFRRGSVNPYLLGY